MSQVTDAGLRSLAENCTALTHLSIKGLNKLTDDSLVVLAAKCRRMKRMDFSRSIKTISAPLPNPKGGDRVLHAIAANWKKLEVLHAAGMRRFSSEGIRAVAAGCPGVCAGALITLLVLLLSELLVACRAHDIEHRWMPKCEGRRHRCTCSTLHGPH